MSELHAERGETRGEALNTSIPSRRTLDGFARQPGCTEGIAIESLEAGTVLTVHTRHSRYRVVVLDGARQRALVAGGSVFPERTAVRIEGATAGGSALKIGWIGVGLRLELSMGRRRITTSRVCSVKIDNILPPEPVSVARPH